MKKSKKNNPKETEKSVLTGHDEKAERESGDRRMFERGSDRRNMYPVFLYAFSSIPYLTVT